MDFIRTAERREPKRAAALRLFCNKPEYALEIIAVTTRGREDLLVCGFCIPEKLQNRNHKLARAIVDFARAQLENVEWEMSLLLGAESADSRVLLMSALLSAYHGATERREHDPLDRRGS